MTTPTDPLDGLLMPYAMVFRASRPELHFMPRAFGPGSSYHQGAIPAGVTTIQLTWNGAGRIVCQYRTAEMSSPVRLGDLEAGASDLEISRMFRISTESEGAYVQFQYAGGPVSDQTDARLGVTVIPMGESLP